MQFTTTGGQICDRVEVAKQIELAAIAGIDPEAKAGDAYEALVAKPREAIAILKFGLPRKPRTVKPKAGRSRKNTRPPLEDPPRVRTADEIKAGALR